MNVLCLIFAFLFVIYCLLMRLPSEVLYFSYFLMFIISFSCLMFYQVIIDEYSVFFLRNKFFLRFDVNEIILLKNIETIEYVPSKLGGGIILLEIVARFFGYRGAGIKQEERKILLHLKGGFVHEENIGYLNAEAALKMVNRLEKAIFMVNKGIKHSNQFDN
jgi:hypothetical protein